MTEEAVDAVDLTPVVRRLLDDPGAEVTDVDRTGLGWLNIMDAELHRISGSARMADGRSVGWSLVAKTFAPPAGDATPSHGGTWDFWKREVNAYASGALDELPGELSAPRCAGVIQRPNGVLWLCLEEIADTDPGPWSHERFEEVARRVGAFNGAYLTSRPIPEAEGLGVGGLRSWVELLADSLEGRDPRATRGPLAVAATPNPEALTALLADRGRLLAALDGLPQTFVHRDVTPVNVLVRRGQAVRNPYVVLDWALAGQGAVGEDAAGIVGATLWQLLIDPAQAPAIERRVLRGYLTGLRGAGWQGDEAKVRFGYATTLALRFAPLIAWWADLLDQPDKADWFERKFGRPPARLAQAWGRLQEFTLSHGNEVRRLAH
jgi:hypothetical protein